MQPDIFAAAEWVEKKGLAAAASRLQWRRQPRAHACLTASLWIFLQRILNRARASSHDHPP